MTTATRTRHLRTCHCHGCETTRARKKKQRALNLHRGIPNRVPPNRVQAHLTHLRQTMGWPSIAAAAGCSACYLRRIDRGQVTRINRDTERKILAVRPAQQRDGGLYIDATGTVRRIRALMAAGHSQYAIAAAAETTQYRVSVLSRGVGRVRVMLADRITVAYQLLSETEGASARARSIAKANAWADPTWWEDFGGIDDPDAPEVEGPEAYRYVAIAEDAMWLERQGFTREQVADRLKVTRDRVQQSLRRYAREQEAAAKAATPDLTGEIGELEVAA